jgi:uncharacterized membrane protein (DUF373 family)
MELNKKDYKKIVKTVFDYSLLFLVISAIGCMLAVFLLMEEPFNLFFWIFRAALLGLILSQLIRLIMYLQKTNSSK